VSTPAPASRTKPDRFPTEFHTYWETLDRPSVRRLRAAFQLVLGFDLVPPDEQVLQYGHGHYDADPLAEEFVAQVYDRMGTKVGRAMLETALEHGIGAVDDPPKSLVRLMEDVDEEPSWLDWSLIDRGAKVFRSFGPAAAASAGSGTLLAYTESSIAKPLSLTGTYTGGSALRRFMETQRHTFDVSEQDGLRRGGAGRATSVRVRIMHVYLRRKIGGHEEWDEAAWGVPINQSDALITLMSGSVINALGMRLIGHPVSNSDIAALMHLWRYIGHIMGVHPRWYPATPREGIQLGAVYFLKRAYSAGNDGTELINSYLSAFRPKSGRGWKRRVRDEFNYRVQIGYTRFWLPGAFYRQYDMPFPWPWALQPILQVPVNLAVGIGRKISPRFDSTMDRYCRWRRQTWWTNEMGVQKSRFAAREEFRR
jgi:hypothetical protein